MTRGYVANEVEDFYEFNNKKKMKAHSGKMYLGFVIVFLVGVISAYKGELNLPSILVMLSAGLLALEHKLNGNTTS